VWRGQSYAFSQWLCLQSVSPAFLHDFTIGGSLSASSAGNKSKQKHVGYKALYTTKQTINKQHLD
jgi:hypothetical protein